jgi:hypothetical protein
VTHDQPGGVHDDGIGAEAMRRLRARSVCIIDAGLTAEEIARVEQEFGFEFADDHRAFLSAGLPVNAGLPPIPPGVITAHPAPWPDWRSGNRAMLRDMLDWPVEGVLFDVEHNRFWFETWGLHPSTVQEAVAVATEQLATVPTMVPVYAHRYLPAGRGTRGHPVLSMWQTDIIYYGLDLADYINREFGRHRADADWNPQATVEFWQHLL